MAGLPDWFFPAAGLLLALGLPVVLLATLAHNRRLGGRERHRLGLPAAVDRRLTLRGAVWGGIAAFSGLGLVTGAYMGMRALGIGPVGTLVAAGKLLERERIIIADFVNKTRDTLLGPALTQAFRVDFSQSKLVSPVEADYVRRVLQRMRRPDSTSLTLSVAREIAQREGFKAVVAGELQQVGPSLLISAQLVSADSGKVLASARETARDSTGILDAMDRISKRLRERIGESLRSLRTNLPLAQVTTASLDALGKYSQALHANDVGDDQRAIDLLEEAVAVDSNFAMAWRKLGVMLINDRQRAARAAEALSRAFQLRDRLTFRERKLTENSYYSDVRGSNDSAAAAMQSLLAEYPNDSWAANNLGVELEVMGDPVGAEAAYLRSRNLEPENILAWGNIYTVRLGLAHFDSAAAILALIRQRFPAGAATDELVLLLPLAQRDFAAAEPQIREQIQRYRADPRAQVRLHRLLAGVLTIRGKLAEADRTLVTSAELFAKAGLAGRALDQRARRAVPMAMYRDDPKTATELFEQTLRATPPSGLAERDRPLRWLINTAVRVGDKNRAEELLHEFERNPGEVPGRVRQSALNASRGEVLGMQKETLPQAIAALHRVTAGRALAAVTMADAYDRAGMPDSALAYYQQWADAGEETWQIGIYDIWQPIAFFRLASLYEAKGSRVKAADFYGRFTELWREADPELQPQVREAKRRLAKLLAEPRP